MPPAERSGNGNDVVLAGFLGAGEFLQSAEAAAAEAQQERKEGKVAGLESLVRIEKILQELGMLLDDLIVPIESGAGLCAQFFHLVADALFGPGDGALN